MDYLYIIALLVVFSMALYFYIQYAKNNDVLDIPNDRSSHVHQTVRGAGVIFLLAVVVGLIISGLSHWKLGLALVIGGITGYIDDTKSLSTGVRMGLYAICAALVTSEIISIFSVVTHWIWIPIMFVFILGTVNTFNFMDGINGITILYVGVTLVTLYTYPINPIHSVLDLSDPILLAMLVFAFVNLRKKALCFMGDVGSIILGLFVSFLVFAFAFSIGKIAPLMLFAVYGVDSLGTIIIRLFNRENITQAHRSHAYQFLSNEGKMKHIPVAILYAGIQLFINLLLYKHLYDLWLSPIVFIGVTITILVFLYLLVKYKYDKEALVLWKK